MCLSRLHCLTLLIIILIYLICLFVITFLINRVQLSTLLLQKRAQHTQLLISSTGVFTENLSDHLPLCLELDSTIIDYCCHAPITIKQSIDAVVGPVQSANCVYADTPSQSNGLDRNA